MPGETKKDGENLTQNSNNGKGSVAEKILERLPEVDETEETKKEAEQETSEEETKKPAEKETSEEKPAESEEVVITPNENVVVTKEIAEQFGLEEELIGKTVQFSEEELTAEEESTESTVSGDSVISEELAKDLGLPPSFVGKTLKDAGKSYKETVKWENENNKQIKELQKTVTDLVSKLSNKEISQIEKEANAEAADTVPDPVTEPERFAEWLQKRDDLIMQKILAKVEDNPATKAADEFAAQQMEKDTINSLQKGLPEGIKAAEVLDNWFEDNKDDYDAMVEAGLYKNKPQKLVKDILNWYKANNYDSLKNTTDSEVKKKVHKKTVENLKAKGNKTKTNFSSNPRIKQPKNTTVSRLIKNLEERQALKGTP